MTRFLLGLSLALICGGGALYGSAPAQSAPAEPGVKVKVDYAELRAALIRDIESHARITERMAGLAPLDRRVLKAMAVVPRHEFVPEPLKPFAYINRPLPLGHGQNISQPYLIALMTDLVDITADAVVFETGTGAGYHAAVLAKLAQRVYSVEIIKPLAIRAAKTLSRLGFNNVHVRTGDGYFGWAKHGPYDAMIIKESMTYVPQPLLDQLKTGGRMVVPLGRPNGPQFLTLIRKDADGRIREKRILPVRFSPLQGGERL